MEIPGTTARHAIITDTCRANHTDMGAFEEAVRRLREEYEACLRGWPVGKGVKFHVALLVERPSNDLRYEAMQARQA